MNTLRLSTRSSPLAVWQANQVSAGLRAHGINCLVQPLATTGDIDLVSPIYEMGVEGVFTRELDIAVLNRQADIAVHSLKDMPVVPAKGLYLAAVLERGSYEDLLIHQGPVDFSQHGLVVATSSIRRRAQWLQRYPHHRTENVRGNIQTRVDKLRSSGWHGLIMAKAAYERLQLQLDALVLDWMMPAPGQGAIAVVCREDDHEARRELALINHMPTMMCVSAERQFLHAMKGGCSAPISALAVLETDALFLRAALHNLDGSRFVPYERRFPVGDWALAGQLAADEVLKQPLARDILRQLYSERPGLML